MATFKIPKTNGACADKLYAIKEEKAKVKRQLDKLDDQRKQLEEHLIKALSADNAEGIKGKRAKVSIIKKVIPTATDWDKTYRYIKKNNRFDLLQKRFNERACKDLWEDNKKIPGVEQFPIKKVSLTKA